MTLALEHIVVLFGALQSAFVAIALWAKTTEPRAPNRLLSGLLLCCAALLVEYWVVDTGTFRSAPHLLLLSAPALFALGPLYYQYTRTLLRAAYRRSDLYHFLPAALIAAALSPFYLRAGATKIEWTQGWLDEGFVTMPLLPYLLVALASFQLLAYFLKAYEFLESFRRDVVEEFANPRLGTVIWLRRLSLAFSAFMVLFYVGWGEALYPQDREQLVLPIAAAILALLMLAVGLALFLAPELFATYSHGNLPSPDTLAEQPKYEKTALTEAQIANYLERLDAYIVAHEPYLDGELRLSELAAALDVPAHHLSQTINQALGVSYFELMNRYRVEAAKALLADSQTSRATILEIALRAGFGSKASFNRIFKRHTGLTPSQFQSAKPAP
jgi:AraC-like DNA-binding protein